MGVALSDTLPDELSLHHQFHLPASIPILNGLATPFCVNIYARGYRTCARGTTGTQC